MSHPFWADVFNRSRGSRSCRFSRCCPQCDKAIATSSLRIMAFSWASPNSSVVLSSAYRVASKRRDGMTSLLQMGHSRLLTKYAARQAVWAVALHRVQNSSLDSCWQTKQQDMFRANRAATSIHEKAGCVCVEARTICCQLCCEGADYLVRSNLDPANRTLVYTIGAHKAAHQMPTSSEYGVDPATVANLTLRRRRSALLQRWLLCSSFTALPLGWALRGVIRLDPLFAQVHLDKQTPTPHPIEVHTLLFETEPRSKAFISEFARQGPD